MLPTTRGSRPLALIVTLGPSKAHRSREVHDDDEGAVGVDTNGDAQPKPGDRSTSGGAGARYPGHPSRGSSARLHAQLRAVLQASARESLIVSVFDLLRGHSACTLAVVLHAASVSCFGEDSKLVGRDLGTELLDALGRAPDVVLLFCAVRYDAAEVIAGLYQRLAPETRVVGCSSCAEINSAEAVAGSVTAMGICLGDLSATIARASDPGNDSHAVGRALGAELAGAPPDLVLLFVDGTVLNSTPVLLGLHEVLGEAVPIAGGVAADDLSFVRTEQYVDRSVYSGSAVALALRGPMTLRSVVAGGWEPIGRSRVITRAADSKTISELDGGSALEVYRHYLGTHGRDLNNAGLEFPLGIIATSGVDDRELFIRAVQGATEDGLGIRVSGDIKEGDQVRMMRAVREDLVQATRECLSAALEQVEDPRLALVFNCAGRKVVLGNGYKEELRAAFEVLPQGLPTAGFYTYGELAPHLGTTIHHDETFTALLIGAAPTGDDDAL